jgi:hypothetical protein
MPLRVPPRYGFEHLLGNTFVSRNINPKVVGTVRRSDPDGGSAVPYITGLSGKTLGIQYSKSDGSESNQNITFASNSFKAAIDLINLADPGEITAFDQEGFLAVQNVNGGKNHYIQIVDGGVNDASTLFGFFFDPHPGSRSNAGEVAYAPVGRSQKNPPGTAMLAKDETISDQAVNRAIAGLAVRYEQLLAELDREILVVEETELLSNSVTQINGAVAIVVPSGYRIPINLFEPDVTDPGPGELAGLFSFVDDNGDDFVHPDLNKVPRLSAVVWGNGPANTVTGFDETEGFTTYFPLPAPIAKSVYGQNAGGTPTTAQLKIAPVAITSIVGNVISVGASTFSNSNRPVMEGDFIRIRSSSVDSPFNHNGLFIIDRILGSTKIQVRPANFYAPGEPNPYTDDPEYPPGLNQGTVGMGTLEVPVGNFLHGKGIILITDIPAEDNNADSFVGLNLRMVVGGRIRATPLETFSRPIRGTFAGLVDRLISDGAPDGASFIGANGIVFPNEFVTVRQQLDYLYHSKAGKETENTFTETQTVNAESADDSASLKTDYIPTRRKLLWELVADDASNNGIATRLYYSNDHRFPGPGHAVGSGLEMTVNAKWDPSDEKWHTDNSAESAYLYRFGQKTVFKSRDQSGPDSWADDGTTSNDWQYTDMSLPQAGNSPATLPRHGLSVGDPTLPWNVPRLMVSRDNDIAGLKKTLILEQESPPISPAFQTRTHLRMYASGTGAGTGSDLFLRDALEVTINAAWQAGDNTWALDDGGQPSISVVIDPNGALWLRSRSNYSPGTNFDPSTTSFPDNVISETIDQSNALNPKGWNGLVALSSFSFKDVINTLTFDNSLITQKRIPNAWGVVSLLAGVPTIVDGWNISSVSGTPSHLRIIFSNNFANSGKMAVIGQWNAASGVSPAGTVVECSITASQLIFLTYDLTGTIKNLSDINSGTFSFAVYGLLAGQ